MEDDECVEVGEEEEPITGGSSSANPVPMEAPQLVEGSMHIHVRVYQSSHMHAYHAYLRWGSLTWMSTWSPRDLCLATTIQPEPILCI